MGRVDFVLFIIVYLVCDLILIVRNMDLELVNRLAEVLILDDGDGPVLHLNKAGVEEGKKRLDLCLIGKVIGPRPANKDGIERAMKGVWKINHRFQVEELSSKNIFRFFFGCREDRQRVFGGGPWTIDKQLICFVKPMGLGEISKMNFDFTSFWISINNVPLACMTELFAREWGERIGKLEDIKIVNGTMKVRVRMNIIEPLKRGLRVAIDDQGNEVSLIFQYDHLPDFCYDCGIIGHKALDCPLKDFAGDNPQFDSGRFGSWLCAPSSPPRDSFRFNKRRPESPTNRPIMTMGEASKIISAVERSRPRFSGLTPEQLAPTSVLEGRERDEDGLTGNGIDRGSGGEPEVPSESRVRSAGDGHDDRSSEGFQGNIERKGKATTVICEGEDVNGLAELLKSKEVHPCEAWDASSVGVTVENCEEINGGGPSKDRSKEINKGKGILLPSSQEELSFSHAFQHTFEPILKTQKSKTWKRANSSTGRSSKGKPKSSSFPISPKLSHVIVANALNKLSPRSGCDSKRKMDVEYNNESSGGLLLLWNDDWEVSVKSFTSGHIDALVKCPGRELWRFTGFYGNPKASCRSESWRLLCRLKDLFDLPWICGGDFNEILSINEKKGGSDRSMSAMTEFQNALDRCSLADLGFEGQCFTWLNKRQGGAHVQERLDRYFCNQRWHDLFPFVKVLNGDFLNSDHRPIVATLENVSRRQRSWLSLDCPLANQDSLIDIFGLCADQLGMWNKSKYGSLPRQVRETQKQLDDLLSVSAPLAILDIPLGSSGCADRWCWHYSSNGSYTVKSGCGEESETPEHALVFCSSLLPLWTNLRIWHYLYRGRVSSLAELLVYLFEVLSKDEFELVSMVWWWVVV
ncbi:hypothetical protein G4B88_012929 [Cannabis sativa]|uniref:CCHC-type domain-containing protein n=1 Tax=Cannabis sativa TaxID=3483 RepID=A0A7J6DPD3_CANSA|nr:hypothetical protein G4B88_012929 [Cannabis sativa]